MQGPRRSCVYSRTHSNDSTLWFSRADNVTYHQRSIIHSNLVLVLTCEKSTFPTIDMFPAIQNPQETLQPLDFDVTRAKQECTGEKP